MTVSAHVALNRASSAATLAIFQAKLLFARKPARKEGMDFSHDEFACCALEIFAFRVLAI